MEKRVSRGRPIWAKWRVNEDGSIHVIATYSSDSGYLQHEYEFATLGDAAAEFGPSFRDVVNSVSAAGREAGRWRP
jgi:hypothetical protein